MVNKINFPTIEKKINLCFVRKYRQGGKSHYIFYRANIKKKVSEKLKNWLSEHIQKVNNKEFLDYNKNNFEDWQYINLNGINSWTNFLEKAFSLETQEEEILSKIKNQLTAFIIYHKKGNEIIGYTRRISSSSVLFKEGLFSLFLEDSAFNELKEKKGVEIDKYADLIFSINKDESEGIILHKYDFNGTFDIFEQQKNEAVRVAQSEDFLKEIRQGQGIREIIEKDRTIQKMLTNSVIFPYMKEVNFETLKKLKEEGGSEISFKLDEENKKIIFPEEDKKKAIHDYIKAKSYKYQKDLNDKHLLESNPEKVIK